MARPWQLSWRSDHGLAGCAEPEQVLLLAELILTESLLRVNLNHVTFTSDETRRPKNWTHQPRFRSNADLGGVEKISIAKVTSEWLESDYSPLKPLHSGSGLLATSSCDCVILCVCHLSGFVPYRILRCSDPALLHWLCKRVAEMLDPFGLLRSYPRAGMS